MTPTITAPFQVLCGTLVIMELWNGQVLEMLRRLPSNSIHCVFVSVPYWMVRDYGVEGQLGREKTMAEHIANLVEIMREIRRVLHPSGMVWFNYGYLWAQGGGRGMTEAEAANNKKRAIEKGYSTSAFNHRGQWGRASGTALKASGLREKQSLMLPERLAIAFQEDGWWCRGLVVWEKPNGLSGSIKDRPSANTEAIYMFTKSSRYFYDVRAVRNNERKVNGWIYGTQLRSVWRVPIAASRSGHPATFPIELPRRAILLSTSELGCCPECLAPVKPVYIPGQADRNAQRRCGGDANGQYNGKARRNYAATQSQDPSKAKANILKSMRPWKLVGANAGCKCLQRLEDAVPCRVLDPFSGEGTTGDAALINGRAYTGIELNPKDVEFQRGYLGPKAQLVADVRRARMWR